MSSACATDRPRIVLLAGRETSSSVLYGLYDALWSVGPAFPELTGGAAADPLLEVWIADASGRPFRCAGEVPVEPHAAVEAIAQADAVVVCDRYPPIDGPPLDPVPAEAEWLRRMHAGGALVCSVCSGSLVLAEAGLLDGREAASHWAYDRLFKTFYPAVRLRRNATLCLSAEAERVVTAGGVMAWQDLALYLIARFCGQEHAVRTAKVFLFNGHDEGQLPFTAINRRIDASDAVVAACQCWIAEHYALPNPVERMAGRARLTPRTFSRRFKAATGYRPIDYVRALRVEEAKQMLETNDCTVEDIALAVGYEDAASFRRIFKHHAGLTPAAYRLKYARIARLGGSRPPA